MRLPQAIPRESVITLKRQAPALILCIAAACVAAGTATGDPSVSAKQAQARQVLAQITQLDGSVHRAQNRSNSAANLPGAPGWAYREANEMQSTRDDLGTYDGPSGAGVRTKSGLRTSLPMV